MGHRVRRAEYEMVLRWQLKKTLSGLEAHVVKAEREPALSPSALRAQRAQVKLKSKSGGASAPRRRWWVRPFCGISLSSRVPIWKARWAGVACTKRPRPS